MARRRGDEPTPEDKGSRSEPNLELPSFRLGRRKKKSSEPVAERVSDVPAPKPAPPAPPRATPKPPSVPKPPQPPARAAAPKRRPPSPPRPDEVLVPKRVPKPPMSVEVSSPTPPQAKRERKVKEPKAPKPPQAKRSSRKATPLKWLPGWLASILTGAACGALTVVLAWGTAQGCDAVRGVGTCGSFGIVALVAILGIDVIVATGLLRVFRVSDPTTTSFLGVGLVAVSAMLFFLKDTQSHSMVYVIPILMAVTFAMSWWVTQAIAPGNDD